MMKLCEILSGPETWCQFAMFNGAQQCLVGAMIRAGFATPTEWERLRTIIGLNLTPIALWNDMPGRTWEDIATVVEAYDRDRFLNP